MNSEPLSDDESQDMERAADVLNSSSKDELVRTYKKTSVMGFFILDSYPKDSRSSLVGGFQNMTAPPGKRSLDWTPEEVPRLHEEGYLRAYSWSSIGLLSGTSEGFPFSPRASSLPAEFLAVTVDVSQFADFSFLAMYGFILRENLENDFRERFVHSEDMVTDASGPGGLKRFHRRPIDRGRIEQIEKKARDWVAQFVSGTWISSAKSHEECPTIFIADVEDPQYRPGKDWFWENYRILDQMGAQSHEVSADDRLAVAPSTILLRGEGSPNRGLVMIHFNRLDEYGNQTTPFGLVQELRSAITELAVRIYSVQYRSSVLSLKLPDFNKSAESLQNELFSVARDLDQNKAEVKNVKTLQGVVKRIGAATREVIITVQGQRRHSELFDSYPTRATRFSKLPFLEKVGDVATFGAWLDQYAQNLSRIALSESQVIADQLTTNSAYADSLFQSVSTLADLRLQSNIRTFTFVVVLLTIVVPVSIALIEYLLPRH